MPIRSGWPCRPGRTRRPMHAPRRGSRSGARPDAPSGALGFRGDRHGRRGRDGRGRCVGRIRASSTGGRSRGIHRCIRHRVALGPSPERSCRDGPRKQPARPLGAGGDAVTPAFDPAAVGLYLHVPFCAALCGYCDFFRIEREAGVPEGFEDSSPSRRPASTPTARPRTRPRMWSKTWSKTRLSFVTRCSSEEVRPPLLEPERLAKLMEGLGKVFQWAPDPEVTLEANPETITEERLAGWRAAGVTRLSVGVQSLSPGVLTSLERRATADISLRALQLAAEAGYEHLSADCMTAVPGQRITDLRSTLDTLAALPLGPPLGVQPGLAPSDPALGIGDAGRESASRRGRSGGPLSMGPRSSPPSGLRALRNLEFRQAGRALHRHNLRYWQSGQTIGLGPSAWSRFGGRLYGNP